MGIYIMEKALTIQREVQKILETEEVYLVGGSVRDLVMGNNPKDYDFTTPMLPDEMIEKVKAAGRRVYTIGEKFGTIGFKVLAIKDNIQVVDGGFIEHSGDYQREITQEMIDKGIVKQSSIYGYEYVEVTTFRSEVYTSKSRKPDVEFVTSLDEDLARRDFTMNSMVLKSNGDIYDPYAGRLDIYQKLIKTVGKPKDRIQEDPLRMLRAARFAARYDFDIDHNFIGKSKQLVDSIYNVSVERWCDELDKILVSNNPYKGLSELDRMGVLIKILPEIYLPVEHDLNMNYVPTIPFNCCDDDNRAFSNNADFAWKFLLDHITVQSNTKDTTAVEHFVKKGIVSRLKFSNKRRDIILNEK